MATFKEWLREVLSHPPEREPWDQQIATGDDGDISVGKAIAFAKTKPEYLVTIPISKIEHDLSWWDEDYEHMKTVDTSYPILVFKRPNGHLTVADGLNRLKKAKSIEHKKELPAYVVPIDDLPDSVFVKKGSR